MHDKTVRRRRAVLGLLVALSLILLSAYFGESAGGGLHTVQSGFLDVLSPIQDGASRVLTPVRDLFSWVGGVFTASSERDRLRKRVLSQQEQIARLQARANVNAQAARILRMDRELGVSSYRQVTARVIYHSSNLWYSQVTIDAGTGDGVRANDAVIAGSGLVGMVTLAAGNSSVVTLITDSSSAVTARDASSGAIGVLEPAVGNPNTLLLNYVSNTTQVSQGDLLVTAGTVATHGASLFPPRIPIGRVTAADPTNPSSVPDVAPLVDLKSLDYVQVLTDPRGARAAGSIAAAK